MTHVPSREADWVSSGSAHNLNAEELIEEILLREVQLACRE
jgi:hypothetical protein